MKRPDTTRPVDLDGGAAQLLRMVRTRGPLTRAQMNERTGWARMTVTNRLDQLLAAGLLVDDDPVAGARGRPATRYRVDTKRAALLVADIGAKGMRIARVDLGGDVEAHLDRRVEIGSGPDRVLEVVRDGFVHLAAGAHPRPLWGAALSLPGPVDFRAGRVVSPPIMTGWDGIPVRQIVTSWFDVPVLIDNDVNAMAAGEQSAFTSADRDGRGADLLVVKVGTGVGSGIITDGRVLRGAAGAAGDIGHTWADASGVRSDEPECRCGKRGCVEAHAGGWALARDASAALGHDLDVDAVVDLLEAGDPTAVRLMRDAGRVLGASLATAVSLLNPSGVVLAGRVALAGGDHLLSALRERVYARVLPLATRDLTIRMSDLGRDAGVVGLAHNIVDVVMSDPTDHDRHAALLAEVAR